MDDLTAQECIELLEAGHVAHLAVISDGQPYVSPVSYVFDGRDLSIRTGAGRRLDAIRQNPRVCIEVSTTDEATGDWRSVIAWGNAGVVDDAISVQTINALLLSKYRDAIDLFSQGRSLPGGNPIHLSVTLDMISGRSSGSFLSMRSRPGRF